jgi:glycosyltransferase involved in cell wall biosynthesis
VIPIGIVTRNRVAYLDATLRSLSATNLPDGISLTVYDDGSDDPTAAAYYFGHDQVEISHEWPTRNEWLKLGLGFLNENNPIPTGIGGKVLVQRLGSTPLGVVNASCAAIRDLFERHPGAPGVLLLQDDEVFNVDWYERMTSFQGLVLSKGPLGLLAGIRLNRPIKEKNLVGSVVVQSFATAQCLYLSGDAFTKMQPGWFAKKHKLREKFDDKLFEAVRKAGFGTGLIHPFVCQHIGMVSLVRPRRSWNVGGRHRGRVGYYSRPPYVLADTVRQFA